MVVRVSDSTDPAASLIPVVPSDVTILPTFRGLYIGVTGNVTLLAVNDTVPTLLLAVPAGTLLPVYGTKVMATGTTAASIVALR